MRKNLQFYIDGSWVKPAANTVIDVINPADETVAGQVALGGTIDVDEAVAAARAPSRPSRRYRLMSVLHYSIESSQPTSCAHMTLR